MAFFFGRRYKSFSQRVTQAGWDARADDELLIIRHGTGWSFDASQVSLTPMNLGVTELVATNYVRKPVLPSAPSWSGANWYLQQGTITWDDLGTAEDIEAIIHYEKGVDDDASIPLWAATASTSGAVLVTLDGTDLTFTPTLGI